MSHTHWRIFVIALCSVEELVITFDYAVGPMHGHSRGHTDHTDHRVTLRAQPACLALVRFVWRKQCTDSTAWYGSWGNPTWFCILHLPWSLWHAQWVFSASGNKHVFYVWGEILSFSRNLRSMTHKSSDWVFLKNCKKKDEWSLTSYADIENITGLLLCVFINLS